MLDETDRQLEVLREIFAWTEKHGFAPTIRELCVQLKISSTNGMKDHLKALKRKDMVAWSPRKARTLSITPRGLDRLLGRAA